MRNCRGMKIIVFVTAIFCFVALIAGLWGGRLAAEETTASGITMRTLPRKYDVIKVSGSFLARFNEVPIKNLSLLAFKDGTLSPIPFQVDERDRKGHYVMTSGKVAGRDEDDGKLDPNDELVFLVSDAGDRLPEEKRFLEGKRIEIEMTDPRYPKQRSWAYLTRYDNAAPRSDIDYVRYDPSSERIISDYAIVGYRKGFMFYNDLIFPTSAGGDGKDFLDRIKLRFRVDFLGGRVSVMRNEEVVTASVEGWIDGPVRVVQLTRNKLKLLDKLPSIDFDGLSEYYPHMMSTPILIRVPFDPGKVSKLLGIRNMSAEIFADMPGMIGGYSYSNLTSGKNVFTGHTPKELIDKLPKKGIIWGFATKKGVGTWFPRMVFPDPMYQFNSLYVTDDVTLENPPDDIPGQIACGVRMDLLAYPPEIVQSVAAGSFELRFETYYATPGLTSEGAREWLDIQDYPLFVDVHGGDLPTPTAEKKATGGPPWKGGRDGVITDTRDRKIHLTRMAYFIGSIEGDPNFVFSGERVTDKTFHNVPLSKIRSLTNRCVEFEPVTKTPMAMFTKLALQDASTLDLLGCKMCGWAGSDENGRVIYLPNSQVKRVDFE